VRVVTVMEEHRVYSRGGDRGLAEKRGDFYCFGELLHIFTHHIYGAMTVSSSVFQSYTRVICFLSA